MAVVIPFIAIVAGGVAVSSAVAAGVITVAAVAGAAAIVSGVASLAGETKIAKIAGIVALGAGAFSLVAGGAAAASGAEGMEMGAAAADGGTVDSLLAGQRGNTAIADAGSTIEGNAGQSIADNATTAAPGADTAALEAAAYKGGAPQVSPGAMPGTMSGAPAQMPARSILAETMGTGAAPGDVIYGVTPGTSGSPVANTFTDSLKNVGAVLRENKELVNLAGGALKGAFGGGAGSYDLGRLSIYQQELELKRQQIEREQANANNLVGLRLPPIFNPSAPPLRRPGQG